MTILPMGDHARQSACRGRGPPRLRLFGVGLALLALSAILLMPLVVVCRTYKSLDLGDVPPCCASKKSCTPATGTASIGTGEINCPYCKAAAPFRHAHPQWTPRFLAQCGQLHAERLFPPRSQPGSPPDLIGSRPRAPPLSV